MTAPAGGARRADGWARAAVQLAFGVVLAEGTLRLVYATGLMPMSLYWAWGPASGRLGYVYASGGNSEAPQFRFDPELGWVNNPGVLLQNGSTITVDARGLRSTGADPALRSGLRVMITGDSFAFGADADDAWWYGAELERLTGVDLVDVAVQSYGADQAYLRYLREVDAWAPDVAILALNSLMADRALKDFELGPKPVLPAEAGVTAPQNVPVSDPDTTRAALRWWPRLLLTAEMARWAVWYQTHARVRLGEARTAAIAALFARDARARGIVPVVVWFPLAGDMVNAHEGRRLLPFNGMPCPQEAVCLDPTHALAPLVAMGAPLTNGTHWSREVSEGVARELAAALAALPPR